MLEAIRLKLSDNPFQDHRVSQDPGTKTSRIDATSKHDLFQPSKITRVAKDRGIRLSTLPPRLAIIRETIEMINEWTNQRTAREKMVYNLARTTSIAFTVVETFDAVPGHAYGHAQYRRRSSDPVSKYFHTHVGICVSCNRRSCTRSMMCHASHSRCFLQRDLS